jgi:hypothetical protein
LKPLAQQLREAAVVAGCTVVWTAFGVFAFDRIPESLLHSAAVSFAPVTGIDAAVWFLPAALVVLFVAGWMATLGLIFGVLKWHIRDDVAPVGDTEDDRDGLSQPVQDTTERLG